MKYLFLSLVLGFTTIFQVSDSPLPDNSLTPSSSLKGAVTFGSDFFPLDLNKTLIYNSSFGDLELKVTREKNIYLFNYYSDKFKYRQKLFINDRGLFVNETYQKLKLLLFFTKEGNYVYDKPLLRVPFPVTVGQQWTWSGNQFVDGETGSVSAAGKAINFETIATPYGKFEALKVQTTLETSAGSKNVLTEWYVKNIGMVKMNVIIEGGGMLGIARDILGYGTIEFELKEIRQ